MSDIFIVKTNSPASGKGVFVTTDEEEAWADIKAKTLHGSVVVERGIAGADTNDADGSETDG